MNNNDTPHDEVIAETPYLRLVMRRGWSFVERTTASGVVSIAARTRDDRIVLVEQYRAPVDGNVIELPAGLSGDLADDPDESLETAAKRELLEETGYEAASWRRVIDLVTSSGLTNEVATIFVADDLEKTGTGGGDASEDITVHEVPLDEVDQWLYRAQEAGKLIDSRIYAGLYLLKGTS